LLYFLRANQAVVLTALAPGPAYLRIWPVGLLWLGGILAPACRQAPAGPDLVSLLTNPALLVQLGLLFGVAGILAEGLRRLRAQVRNGEESHAR
jgi:hypothetical protein